MSAKAKAIARRTTKQRTLDLIKSLDDEDDDRTAISKKISWILRHGRERVGLKVSDDGWVKIGDLRAVEILDDINEEVLKSVIVDSNQKKLRYQLKDGSEGQLIRAYTKEERKSLSERGSNTNAQAKSNDGNVKLRQDAPEFVPNLGPVPPVPPFHTPSMSQLSYQPPYPAQYPWGMYPNPAALMGQYPFPLPPFPNVAPPLPPSMPVTDAVEATAGRYRGRIKSFNPDKGFGFIDCPKAHAQYNRDVFVHIAQIGDFKVGTEVTFSIETNKQGMPQAKDLQNPGGHVPMAANVGSKGAKGKSKGKAKDKDSEEKGKESKEPKGKTGGGRGKGSKSTTATKESVPAPKAAALSQPIPPGEVAPSTKDKDKDPTPGAKEENAAAKVEGEAPAPSN